MSPEGKLLDKDTRQNLRVGESIPVFWRVKDSGEYGRGMVKNISTSGMLLETNSNFKPNENCLFNFDTTMGGDNFIPHTGRLVWYKKKPWVGNRHACGIQFVEPGEEVVLKLRERIQNGIVQLANVRKWTSLIRASLYTLIFGVLCYIVWMSVLIYGDMASSNKMLINNTDQQATLTRTFKYFFEETKARLIIVTEELARTKQLYEESQAMLKSVTQELEATKAILAQTEAMLTEARASNGQLVSEMDVAQQQFTQTKTDLETNISNLQAQNGQLKEELTLIKDQLKRYEGQFETIDEGKELLNLFRSRIRLVKSKVQILQVESKQAKVHALKERDKLRMALGNNGYFVKDGSTVIVDIEKYNAAGNPTAANTTPAAEGENKVSVDVKLFQ